MADGRLPLPVVDAADLPRSMRTILRPGDVLRDEGGKGRRLPRLFYEIDSWQTSLELDVSEHFRLWEFIGVDVREAPEQRQFPRYVPCAVTLIAAHLEVFRREVGTYVHIAANGGYRSPLHRLTRGASPHCWATAVNIYRVGDDWLSTREQIERYASIARRISPSVWVRPYGGGVGQADDHLHIDIGYAILEPRDSAGIAVEASGVEAAASDMAVTEEAKRERRAVPQ